MTEEERIRHVLAQKPEAERTAWINSQVEKVEARVAEYEELAAGYSRLPPPWYEPLESEKRARPKMLLEAKELRQEARRLRAHARMLRAILV